LDEWLKRQEALSRPNSSSGSSLNGSWSVSNSGAASGGDSGAGLGVGLLRQLGIATTGSSSNYNNSNNNSGGGGGGSSGMLLVGGLGQAEILRRSDVLHALKNEEEKLLKLLTFNSTAELARATLISSSSSSSTSLSLNHKNSPPSESLFAGTAVSVKSKNFTANTLIPTPAPRSTRKFGSRPRKYSS
jgi:hypothetical protein